MKAHSLIVSFVLMSASQLHGAGFVFNENFTVFTEESSSPEAAQAFAQDVLNKAEKYRRDIALRWLGEQLPPSVGQTTINVSFATTRDDGLTWAKDSPQRKHHTVYLSTSPERALGSTLAHEMTHVVLATRFPHPNQLPAWIEEGIASTYDDDARQQTRRATIAWFARTGNWPELAPILTTENIRRKDQHIYAVASSLVEFLLSKGDKRTLLEFGQSAKKDGYDTALKQHYDFAHVRDLRTAWQAWASQPTGMASIDHAIGLVADRS